MSLAWCGVWGRDRGYRAGNTGRGVACRGGGHRNGDRRELRARAEYLDLRGVEGLGAVVVPDEDIAARA